MNRIKQLSITLKLMLSITGLMIVVMVSISSFFINFAIKKDKVALENRIVLLSKTITVPAAKFIWDFDLEKLQEMADHISRDPEIIHIEFRDLEGKLLNNIDKNEDKKVKQEDKKVKKDNSSNVYSLDLKGGDENKVIAKMKIFYTFKILEEKKNNQIMIFALGTFCALLVVNFISFFIIRSIVSSLINVTNRLTERAENMKRGSGVINKASQNILLNTESQASSTKETGSTLFEISSMVDKNITNVQKTTDSTSQGQEMANSSMKYLERMNNSLNDISDNVKDILSETDQNNERIIKMSKIIENIGQKTKVINDIVFQTKLLSFNASVEAARAGENGKGFSIVAEEIGSLAAVSGNAAQDINNLLIESKNEVETIIKVSNEKSSILVEKNKNAMEQGIKDSTILKDSLGTLVQKVGEINSYMLDVRTASIEQSEGIKNINKAVSDIEDSINSNSLAAKKGKAISDSLNDEALKLNGSVDNLLKIVKGN